MILPEMRGKQTDTRLNLPFHFIVYFILLLAEEIILCIQVGSHPDFIDRTSNYFLLVSLSWKFIIMTLLDMRGKKTDTRLNFISLYMLHCYLLKK